VDCLRSLAAQTFTDAEIIVVDDGSTDDTAAVLQRDFPHVVVETMPENSGFAKATNAGIRRCSGEWVFLLNNDMTLESECLEKLVDTAEAGEAQLIAPLVLWRDEPATVYSAGDLIQCSGRPESHGFRVPRADLVLPETIFGVSAGAGLFHRSVFDTVGLLDEAFLAYFEDADLCFRARLAGFQAALAPEAVTYHIGSATIQGRTWWRCRQCFINHALLLIKNMPAALCLRYAPAIIGERLNQARRLFSSARTEFGALRALGLLLRAALQLAGKLPYALGQRRKIRGMRKISNQQLNDLLGGKPGT
jgi:GT2 family glycosyltransferase